MTLPSLLVPPPLHPQQTTHTHNSLRQMAELANASVVPDSVAQPQELRGVGERQHGVAAAEAKHAEGVPVRRGAGQGGACDR